MKHIKTKTLEGNTMNPNITPPSQTNTLDGLDTAVNLVYPEAAFMHAGTGMYRNRARLTYEELALVLKEFGAVDAIAFDGGGSATLVMADVKDGEPKVFNCPSDGQERAGSHGPAI